MLPASVDIDREVKQRLRQRCAAAAFASGIALASSVVAPPARAVGCNPADFAGGSGTLGSPFRIGTAAQLQAMNGAGCQDGAFILTADVTLTGSWTPIGSNATPFEGRFDGAGFAVSGLSISAASAQQGLFGVIRGAGGANSVIRDLRIVNASVTGTSQVGVLAGRAAFASLSAITVSGSVNGTTQVGGVIGQLGAAFEGSTLSDSTSSVVVVASGAGIGGLVGLLISGSSISSSSASGSVSGTTQVGGLVGEAAGGITSSSVHANVTASAGSAGGLAGTSSSTITSSSATGSVTGAGADVGGLVGTSTGSVSEAWASGSVSAAAQANVGGLVGSFNSSGDIVRSFATGAVTGGTRVGGLVGLVTQSSLADVYSSGSVTGATTVGGLIGYADVPSVGTLQRAYATGTTSATGAPVGGLIASGHPVTVSDSAWATDATGQALSPGGGAARTLLQLQSATTFTGWSMSTQVDAATTWGICPALNQGTPFLQWYATSHSWRCNGIASAPPPWLQAYGRHSADDPCEPGWGSSWGLWMNGGTGGFTCVRIVRSLG